MSIDNCERPACFIVNAARGNRALARKLIALALREVLRLSASRVAALYVPRHAVARNSDARFCVSVNASEFDAIMNALDRRARHAGFSAAP